MSASPTHSAPSLPVGTTDRAKYAYARLTQDGATLREIAGEFGVSHQAVCEWLVKRGYPPVSTLVEYRCAVCKRVYVDSPSSRSKTCGRPRCKTTWTLAQARDRQRRIRVMAHVAKPVVRCANCARPLKKVRVSAVGSPPFCHRPECNAARTRWWYRNVPSYRAKMQARQQGSKKGAPPDGQHTTNPKPLTRADYEQLPLPLDG